MQDNAADFQKKIDALEEKLKSQGEALEKLSQGYTTLETANANLKASASEKDEAIRNMKGQIATLEAQHKKLENMSRALRHTETAKAAVPEHIDQSNLGEMLKKSGLPQDAQAKILANVK